MLIDVVAFATHIVNRNTEFSTLSLQLLCKTKSPPSKQYFPVGPY